MRAYLERVLVGAVVADVDREHVAALRVTWKTKRETEERLVGQTAMMACSCSELESQQQHRFHLFLQIQ